MPSLTARYNVANGQIIAEYRGNQRRFYRTDALGSTVSLYDGKQNKTDSFTYWPYGEVRTNSGIYDTKYMFVGGLGCRMQGDGGIYMRARVLQTKDGRWLTVDPIWPTQRAYEYASDNPSSKVDLSGMWPNWWPYGKCIVKGKPIESPSFLWPHPCTEVESESCNRLCAPHGAGKTVTVNGQCFCYCIPVWVECGINEILACIGHCKGAGFLFDKCTPFSVTETFDWRIHCKCKQR